MYDVTSGDKTSKVVAAVVAFFVLAPISVFFMMWWGYGGYAAIAPAWAQSLFMQISIYLCVELVVVQGFFFGATRTTRMGALYGFLSPWSILALIAIPQFSHSPKDVLLILLVPVLTFTSHVVVEKAFHDGDGANAKVDPSLTTAAIGRAISKFRENQSTEEICPTCKSHIQLTTNGMHPTSGPHRLSTSCECGACSGSFHVPRS